MSRERVYDPNGEPFDVPSHRVGDLVLGEGWTRTPVDPGAEPAVTTVAPPEADDPDEGALFDEGDDLEAFDEEEVFDEVVVDQDEA